jgi:hypothetical protein
VVAALLMAVLGAVSICRMSTHIFPNIDIPVVSWFLGSWHSTVIVATSIPLSIRSSVIVLWALNYSLNIMTVGGGRRLLLRPDASFSPLLASAGPRGDARRPARALAPRFAAR